MFLPVIYDYIAMGEYSVKDIQDADVPDCLVQCLLAKVYISVELYVHLHTN